MKSWHYTHGRESSMDTHPPTHTHTYTFEERPCPLFAKHPARSLLEFLIMESLSVVLTYCQRFSPVMACRKHSAQYSPVSEVRTVAQEHTD